jgi:hypothetical protein
MAVEIFSDAGGFSAFTWTTKARAANNNVTPYTGERIMLDTHDTTKRMERAIMARGGATGKDLSINFTANRWSG